MLIKDIELLIAKNNEFKFSYPYILLTSSCIDLFGGIEKGFVDLSGRSNSERRFKWFIVEWMAQINQLYKEESLAYLIYDSWRCGVSHQATLKRGFETSSYLYPEDRHLHYIEDNKRIFVHSIQFANDLIAAQKQYRKYINDNAANIPYIDSLYCHLINMIGENNPINKQYFDQFVQLLYSKQLVFESSDNSSIRNKTAYASTTTSIMAGIRSISQENITRLPDELLDVVPSAMPEEIEIVDGEK